MSILPFDWGFDFAWGRMGGNEQEVPINEQHIAATTGDLRINSDIFGYHGLLRLKPFNGKVSPYIEGLAGIRQFTTRTRIHVEGMDSPYVDQRNANEFIWSHGWAAGLQIAPAKHFYVEGRVERLNGGKVSYVDPTSIDISPEGVVTYGTLTSGVRVVNIHLGIGLRF
jgi:opacity protein-like surface antigen